VHLKIALKLRTDVSEEWLAAEGREVHAMACSAKPVATWTAQRATQEAREACGGHGYLVVNRIGKLRNENDARCTYEGDNNCILMQTSNYLLQCYGEARKGKISMAPHGSIDFLTRLTDIESTTCTLNTAADITPAFIKTTMQWLVIYLLKKSSEKFTQQCSTSDEFTAKNNSQVYFCRSLAIVYMHNFALERFRADKAFASDTPSELQRPLINMYMLYGLWVIEENLALLFQGGYLTAGGSGGGALIKEAVLSYCLLLKTDALALVDAIAPPDWVLRSPIGHSNGKPLKNLYEAMVTEKSQERPSWWAELTIPVEPGSKSHLIKSNL